MGHPTVQHACCVCALLDDDYTPKPSQFCDFCKAYLCEKHLKSPARIRAWYKVRKGKKCP